MKTLITQIWMVCHLLPFAKVGQRCMPSFKLANDVAWVNDRIQEFTSVMREGDRHHYGVEYW